MGFTARLPFRSTFSYNRIALEKSFAATACRAASIASRIGVEAEDGIWTSSSNAVGRGVVTGGGGNWIVSVRTSFPLIIVSETGR